MKLYRFKAPLILLIISVGTLYSLPVKAERVSVDFGPFACLPGMSPVVVKEGTYINLLLVDFLNAPDKPWFVEGDSTVSTKLTFHHSTGKEWNYVQTIDKVGDSFSGIDQNISLGPRRMPLPKVIGGFQPKLVVSMIETARTQSYKPFLDGLGKVASTIPNPATAAASTVLGTVSDVYGNVFNAWMSSNGLRIEANLGFSFDSSKSRNCDNLGAASPLLGNVAYLIIGTSEFGGHKINKEWADEYLKLDSQGSHLVF